MSFATAHSALGAALARKLYVTPTPVQAAILEERAQDRDLLVSAQTGTGKTVAFGLALGRTLLGDDPKLGPPGAPLALVVTPTRELAMQVHRELTWLFADTKARLATCVGGFDPRRERHALSQGVHIVVGTPGRLCDHLEQTALVLSRIQAVVLDEADEMLDMGFREDLERLLDAAPETRRTLMFSATIPKPIAALAKRYQRDALRIATQTETDAHRDIEYRAISIVPRERDNAVVNVLRYHEAPGALVFCATRDGVSHLAANLNERGFAVVALSGELSQRERNVALQALRDGRARVCVATDVAARGLDLPDLGLVIHADLPQNKQVLVHRSGRTGRAGKRGLAVVLVPHTAARYVERLLASAHVAVQWMRAPTADAIAARDREQLATEIAALAQDVADDDREVARTLLAKHSPEDLIATLVRVRREARPAPEVLTEPSMPRKPEPRREPLHKLERANDPRKAERHADRREHSPRHADIPSQNHRVDKRTDVPTQDHRVDKRTDVSTQNRRADKRSDAPPQDRHADKRSDVPPQDRPAHKRSDVPPQDRPADKRSDVPQRNREGRANEHPARDRSEHPPRERRQYDQRHGKPRSEEPGPTDVSRESRPHDRRAEKPRTEDATDALPSRWFTVNVGRSKNADPKWLIPLLCRRGGIQKRDIGKIQVLARETRVEIAADVEARFAEAVRQPDPKDKNIHIEPLDATG